MAFEVPHGLSLEPRASPGLAIRCALLHDVLEDPSTTHDELALDFGAEVAGGVTAVPKGPRLPKPERFDDSLRRIRAARREIRAAKAADRIVNLQPPPASWKLSKRRRYRDEARRSHAALASAHSALAARLERFIELYQIDVGEPDDSLALDDD